MALKVNFSLKNCEWGIIYFMLKVRMRPVGRTLAMTIIEDRGSVDRNSVDQNCVLSLDRNFVNHLTEFYLTESVDQNFKITQNDINKSFNQLTKKN